MTPKEKAAELIASYFMVITNLPLKKNWIQIHWMQFNNSKECAKIAVNEIIKEINSINFNYDLDCDIDLLPYYNEVLTEIDKY